MEDKDFTEMKTNERCSESFNTSAIVRVGDGRGFVIAGKQSRFVITARHCLGDFPASSPGYHPESNVCSDLLGPLGATRIVPGRCLFADSINDLAILGPPCHGLFPEGYRRFVELTERVLPLWIEAPQTECFPCFALSSEQHWFGARAHIDVREDGSAVWLFRPAAAITAEMVGSPILAANGSAVSLVSTNLLSNFDLEYEGAPNPLLPAHFPAWFLAETRQHEPPKRLQ
jgi:hypothetical protein